jgi:uncharacterized lipoprotein YajG
VNALSKGAVMKLLFILSLFATALSLAACTSPPISTTNTTTNTRGTPLGDTGIRVTGSVDAGGSVNPR